MDRPTKQDKKKSDDSFLSRWSARKAQSAKGELVADEKPALTVQEVNEGELGNDEEVKLSDQELLEKFELPIQRIWQMRVTSLNFWMAISLSVCGKWRYAVCGA